MFAYRFSIPRWVVALTMVTLALLIGNGLAWAQVATPQAQVAAPQALTGIPPNCGTGQMRCVTQADRVAAAARAKARRSGATGTTQPNALITAPLAPLPGGTPDYFGIYPNYANSPLLRKFVDPLPGICTPGQTTACIPVATKDTTTFPGSDFYQIGLRDYTQQMHSDLPPTPLRGYYDLNPAATDQTSHYLGPLIIARKDVPVRIKFTNFLGLGAAGNLFLPVDTTYMGAGAGPNSGNYTENRATLHLHGGVTPWISDGTPHQWITPAGDPTPYKKGVSFQNVPDMVGPAKLIPTPTAGDGTATFFYSNQQSSRLMFYHDHAYGLTRLNVYAGEAAGYLLTDPIEDSLITAGVLPNQGGGNYTYGIPLIIQDKTFVPDPVTLAAQDPTWNWGGMGSLWFPHVYMTNQNPADPESVNAMGRWDYGPWFWPPQDPTTFVGKPYPCPTPTSPNQVCPGVPNVSATPEAFMDTPVVNGAAYPYFQVGRQAYRFRILNASNDRVLSLQLYYADPAVTPPTGVLGTEVKMVDASPHTATTVPPLCTTPTATDGSGLATTTLTTPTGLSAGCWPTTWPKDGRDGGVPDPATAGPPIIQIGTEGGLLPAPVVIPSTPTGYEYNRRNIVVLNIATHGLILGPAERADVIIDFSSVPDGSKLILYNDAPAPVPAFDSRLDYYTGDEDQSITGDGTGGAPTTQPGYGPNTRTMMQFQVTGGTGTPFNLAALQAALPVAYAASQPRPVVPETAYDAAFGTTTAADNYSHIQDHSMTFTPSGSLVPTTMAFGPKAIQELFTLDYGRMNATLGVELPFTNFNTQTTIPYGYIDPPTEFLTDGVPQIWKITHNGVDTHPVHFHLFNVQVLNRVGWDGQIRPPDSNEIGWKETVRMNPLEDVIVAFDPVAPRLPFAIPDSIRLLDVTSLAGTTGQFSKVDPNNNPIVVVNATANFGWEYVWHCHILGHEENDFMRAMVFTAKAQMITPPPGTSFASSSVTFTWSAGAGVTQTYLWVGTTPGASNLFFNTASTAKTAHVTGLPRTVPVYVRLFSVIGGVSSYNDYIYGPTAKATMISPTPSTTLTGASTTFTWTAGTGVTQYLLSVGTQVGTSNLATFSGTATTFTATLPVFGAKIYVRLTSIIGGVAQFVDYTYTEAIVQLPPTVYLDSPLAGASVSGTVAVVGWAIDNEWFAESAIALVEVFVDGVKVGNASAASRPDVCAAYPGRAGCPNVGFGYVWNTSALSIGNHTLQIVATDSDAPTPHTTTLVRTVTTSLPPTVYLDAPVAGATVAGTVQVHGWAIDNEWRAESAIALVEVFVDGVKVGNASAASRPDVCAAYPGRAGCPNVGFSYVWNTSALSIGNHTLQIVATDSDAPTPHTTTLVRTVTTSLPPTVYLDAPMAGATVAGTVQVYGWAIDNEWRAESAIASVQVLVDGVPAGFAIAVSRPDVCAAYPGRAGCPNVGFSYLWNTSGLSAGSHTLGILATDSDAGTPHTTLLNRTVIK